MTGDCHVRFCESRGVRFPPATRHLFGGPYKAGSSVWERSVNLDPPVPTRQLRP
jgi:hypothetical protein